MTESSSMISTLHHNYPQILSPRPSDINLHASEYASSQRIQTSGLESFSNASPFALHPVQPLSLRGHGIGPVMKSATRVRHHPYDTLRSPINVISKSKDSRHGSHATDNRSSPSSVRRRISRACDQCNQLRTKCDGQTPCAHCIECSLACEYFRERKKRGKASRKDIAQQQATAAAAGTGSGADSPVTLTLPEDHNAAVISGTSVDSSLLAQSGLPSPPRSAMPSRSRSTVSEESMTPQPNGGHMVDHPVMRPHSMGMSSDGIQSNHILPLDGIPEDSSQRSSMEAGSAIMPVNNNYNIVPDQTVVIHHINGQVPMGPSMMQQLPQALGTPSSFACYNDAGFPPMNAQEPLVQNHYPFTRTADSPLANFLAVNASPGWLSTPSPNSSNFPSNLLGAQNTLRYPVLQPIISKLKCVIPISLACDLLDLYFTSFSSAQMHPFSPYLLGFIFRKKSFLHPTHPRQCSSALLASMLWVSAQTSDAPFLASPPSARGPICQKLLELTVGLLRPLIHGPGIDVSISFGTNLIANGVSLSGLGVPSNGDHMSDGDGPTATLDDIATYFHLATVVSASECKAASLRWWNAAWSLARELKLGRELPPNPPPSRPRSSHPDDVDADGDVDIDMGDQRRSRSMSAHPLNTPPGTYTEEEREERRRMWWLLYTVDRHLALAYNKPLFLLDAECADLLQPVSENRWQADVVYTGGSSMFADPSCPPRRRGPTFECTSHSIFGYFTPLMTILGEVVELNQARNHPRFGLTFRQTSDWDQQAAEITQHLEVYRESLKGFEARFVDPEYRAEAGTPSVRSAASGSSRMTESVLQSKIVIAYGTHVLHVLHILLHGKWDPISLLDDSDLWISSQSFMSAMQHAVSGAEAVADILEHDPDLGFMPFFFDIYLLQGSFLLLLIADKLQGEASSNVVNACSTIVRAVEACVVTLNTEYQRNFRKVMRSALVQVKGRIPEDFGQQQQLRREVLSLYRWTAAGTGLAL